MNTRRLLQNALIVRVIRSFGANVFSPVFFAWAMLSYQKREYASAKGAIKQFAKWDVGGEKNLLAHVINGISCAETRDMISAKTAVGTAYDLYLHGAVVPRGWEQDVALAFDMLAAFLRQSGEQDKIEAIQRAADKVRFPHSKIEARG